MILEKFIIQNLISKAFYSATQSEDFNSLINFKGFIFATHFFTKESAKNTIISKKLVNCTIISVFIRNESN